jgi:hypothetical protein
MQTYSANIQKEFIEAGYSFKKDNNDDWICVDTTSNIVVACARQLGNLIKLLEKEFGE